MSINTYDEQKFWEEMDILFPDIVKAITSLAKKSYISITNLRNGVTWWSEKTMEYFGMQENYTIRGQEKSKRSIHPDDLEESGQGTLLKIGLDQFSHINVMYGAAFSDKILNCAAQELLRLLRGKGYVYRLSGAKFVISFKNVSKEELQQIYDEIVEAFENTEVEGKKISLKVSAGAIFMEPYMKETNAVRSRLTYALNHSRLEHHGELVIFNDEVCGSDENQFELIGVIHQCATHNFEGFRMFYQPIADTKTGKIRGMEALLRWELEPYGMVSPGVFMEWLEQDPCIFDLGNWILRTALTGCTEAAQGDGRLFRQCQCGGGTAGAQRVPQCCHEYFKRDRCEAGGALPRIDRTMQRSGYSFPARRGRIFPFPGDQDRTG